MATVNVVKDEVASRDNGIPIYKTNRGAVVKQIDGVWHICTSNGTPEEQIKVRIVKAH